MWDIALEYVEKLNRDLEDSMPSEWAAFSHQARVEQLISAEQANRAGIDASVRCVARRHTWPRLTLAEKRLLRWRAEGAIGFCQAAHQGNFPPLPGDVADLIEFLLIEHWKRAGLQHWIDSLRALPDLEPPTPMPPSN